MEICVVKEKSSLCGAERDGVKSAQDRPLPWMAAGERLRGEIGTLNGKLPRSLIPRGWRILSEIKEATLRMSPSSAPAVEAQGEPDICPPPKRTLLWRSPGGNIINPYLGWTLKIHIILGPLSSTSRDPLANIFLEVLNLEHKLSAVDAAGKKKLSLEGSITRKETFVKREFEDREKSELKVKTFQFQNRIDELKYVFFGSEKDVPIEVAELEDLKNCEICLKIWR
ncbi:hypothetical protein TNCT_133011 [Trichonephila clavata]|uniref:Uncharacterized protein n=1 Tax=Trichonephila clavata TaxID=2740835 RepID=A0A8X6HH24_TRICU|nr:hypothetical protein TNCT_133011 [Trichonephila clavata]